MKLCHGQYIHSIVRHAVQQFLFRDSLGHHFEVGIAEERRGRRRMESFPCIWVVRLEMTIPGWVVSM